MDQTKQGLSLAAAGLLALFAGAVMALALWALDPARLWELREFQLELQLDRPDLVRMQYDTGTGFDAHPLLITHLLPEPQFQKAVFLLPAGAAVRRVRFSPADQAGEVAIRSLTLSSWLHSRRLSAAEIAALIQPATNLTAWTADGDTLRFTLKGPCALIQFSPGDYWHPPFPSSRLLLILTAASLSAAALFWLLRYLWHPALKRTLAALFLAGLAALAAALGLRQLAFDPVNPAVRLSITLQAPADSLYEVFYDQGSAFTAPDRVSLSLRGSEKFQTAVFSLPDRSVPLNLRFDPGQLPDSIRIRSMTLHTALKTLTWQAAKLPALFAPLSQADLRMEGDALVVRSSGIDPYLVGTPALRRHLRELRQLYAGLRRAALLAVAGLVFLAGFLLLRAWRGFRNVEEIRWIDLGLTAGFLLIICLPLANQWLRFAHDLESTEKRTLAARPDLGLAGLPSYPRRYETYFNDHFQFRNQLVRWNSLLRVKWLRTSPAPLVLVGREGWWFMRSEGWVPGTGLDNQLGLAPFSQAEVDRLLRRLQTQADWCQARGILLLFVFCPDKASIYPEYLPRGYRRISAETRLDQVLAGARQYPSLRVLDLRPALREAKKQNLVFLKKDNHWNLFGGFAGYRQIARELSGLFPGISPVEENEVRFTFTTQKQVGWAFNLVGLLNASQAFDDVICDAVFPAPAREGGFPQVLYLHDSMIYGMAPFLKANHGRPDFLHHDLKPLSAYYAQIEARRPAVVVYELSENRLNLLLE